MRLSAGDKRSLSQVLSRVSSYTVNKLAPETIEIIELITISRVVEEEVVDAHSQHFTSLGQLFSQFLSQLAI
jgi:hypothetical protein